MANTVKKLSKAIVGSSLGTVYTAPAATKTMLKEILLCNTSTGNIAVVTIHAVDSGQTAGVLSTILSNQSLAPGETLIFSLSTFLEAGDFIQAVSSQANAVSMYVSGVEMS